jgi:hypothetical protein
MKKATVLFFLSLFIAIIGRFTHMFPYRYFYIVSCIILICIIFMYFQIRKNRSS